MFRFTIRDVLWLTALVAMGVGWWMDHRRLTSPLFVTVSRPFISARMQVGDVLEIERMPNNKLKERIVRAGSRANHPTENLP
jgi:hypothetical protein